MGGEMIQVDIETGIVKSAAIDDYGKINKINYNCHEYYIDQKIPRLEEAKKNCARMS